MKAPPKRVDTGKKARLILTAPQQLAAAMPELATTPVPISYKMFVDDMQRLEQHRPKVACEISKSVHKLRLEIDQDYDMFGVD